MAVIVGAIFISFFMINCIVMLNQIIKEAKESNKNVFRMLIYIPLELLLGTYGFYVAIVLGSLILGLILVCYS